MGSWVIKARPDRNDFQKFPLRGSVGRWYTTRLPRGWVAGDTLFIWAGAPRLRIIGLCRLREPDKGFARGFHWFTVDYLSNMLEGPTIADLRRDPVVRAASFLKVGPAGTVYPLTADQGSRIRQLLARAGQLPAPSRVASATAHTREQRPHLEVSAGFGDVAQNRLVERAAVAVAVRHYRGLGWQVQSRERQRCGYDLECRRGRQRLHVEVKGVGGDRRGFIMTAGERDKAERDRWFELCLVRAVLRKPIVETMSAGDMFEHFQFQPLSYYAKWTTRA